MEPILVTFAVFVAVTGLILSGYYALTAESAATRRLGALAAESTGPARRGEVERGLFKSLVMSLAPYGFGSSDVSLGNTLTYAGLRTPSALVLFVGARLLVSVGPALMVLVLGILNGKPLGPILFRAVLMWIGVHVLVTRILRRRAQRRIDAITRGLPDSLDLMVVCLEAGLGLNSTIARVGQERSRENDPLGIEFAQVATEMRGGRSREEALRALGARNGSDDLRGLTALIIQSDRLGASMAQTLRAHADLLRTKRRQRAEEAARKLPIKMLFPLALFILPPLFVMVAGPAMIILKDFARTMAVR
jgi:tight adherence protein C